MAELKDVVQAKATFDTLCKALDKHQWHYEKDEEKLSIECGAQGDDLPMQLSVQVDADRMLVMLLSHLPFTIPEDKRIDAAVAVSAINNMLVDGSFDFDITSGHMFFRMTNSFIESKMGEDVFEYLLFCACHTIDDYNDKLLMLGKGTISIEKFLELLDNE